MFKGRKLAIATQHRKEEIIAPLLQKSLGVQCFVPPGLDTDALGTFTGEIERKDDPLATLRAKCQLAMAQTGCDLVVASEGSFGPHPTLFFALAGDELVMLLDARNNLEIVGRDLSTETNFGGCEVESEDALMRFAKGAGFPEHTLILRNAKGENKRIIKGISTEEKLRADFRKMLADFGSAYAETDMRALYNPTRMQAIGRATEKLIEKALSLCPKCSAPGFGITEVRPGLPCKWCGTPTESALSYWYRCAACDYSEAKPRPDGRTAEEPMYCPSCNP